MRGGWLLRRPLSITEVLRWASIHHQSTGKWPTKDSGDIAASSNETWLRVDAALRNGTRGLPGGSSLAQLLAQEVGARNVQDLVPLTTDLILQWADAWHQRTKSWPRAKSGHIPECQGETWQAIHAALRVGLRGLPAGSSLPRLLWEHRGVRNRTRPAPLSESQILEWIDAFHLRTGAWPTSKGGPLRRTFLVLAR
jgi:hypothetical protein